MARIIRSAVNPTSHFDKKKVYICIKGFRVALIQDVEIKDTFILSLRADNKACLIRVMDLIYEQYL